MKNARVLTDGLRFPEGPVAMDDGSVIVTETRGFFLMCSSFLLNRVEECR